MVCRLKRWLSNWEANSLALKRQLFSWKATFFDPEKTSFSWKATSLALKRWLFSWKASSFALKRWLFSWKANSLDLKRRLSAEKQPLWPLKDDFSVLTRRLRIAVLHTWVARASHHSSSVVRFTTLSCSFAFLLGQYLSFTCLQIGYINGGAIATSRNARGGGGVGSYLCPW
jgi:hypothetical protein